MLRTSYDIVFPAAAAAAADASSFLAQNGSPPTPLAVAFQELKELDFEVHGIAEKALKGDSEATFALAQRALKGEPIQELPVGSGFEVPNLLIRLEEILSNFQQGNRDLADTTWKKYQSHAEEVLNRLGEEINEGQSGSPVKNNELNPHEDIPLSERILFEEYKKLNLEAFHALARLSSLGSSPFGSLSNESVSVHKETVVDIIQRYLYLIPKLKQIFQTPQEVDEEGFVWVTRIQESGSLQQMKILHRDFSITLNALYAKMCDLKGVDKFIFSIEALSDFQRLHADLMQWRADVAYLKQEIGTLILREKDLYGENPEQYSKESSLEKAIKELGSRFTELIRVKGELSKRVSWDSFNSLVDPFYPPELQRTLWETVRQRMSTLWSVSDDVMREVAGELDFLIYVVNKKGFNDLLLKGIFQSVVKTLPTLAVEQMNYPTQFTKLWSLG